MKNGVRELAQRPPGNLQTQGANASPQGNHETVIILTSLVEAFLFQGKITS